MREHRVGPHPIGPHPVAFGPSPRRPKFEARFHPSSPSFLFGLSPSTPESNDDGGAIGLPEFWRRCVAESLIPAETLSAIEKAFADAQGHEASGGHAMADFLVEHRRLTRFQANCLLATPAIPLQFAGFRLRDRQTPSPLSKWVVAARLHPNPSDPSQVGFLLRSRSIDERFKALASDNRSGLAPASIVTEDQYSAIYLPLGGGECLDRPAPPKNPASTATKRPPSDTLRRFAPVIRSWRAWTDSIGPHGRLEEQRIWNFQDRLWLLWEPAVDTWFDGPPRFDHSLAPEQWTNGSAATVAADAYALGCLLYRQIFAREAFEPTAVAHRGPLPMEIQTAVQQGATGDPTLRLIAHLLSRDANARLSDPSQMLKAVEAVLAVASKRPTATGNAASGPPAHPEPATKPSAARSPKSNRKDASAASTTSDRAVAKSVANAKGKKKTRSSTSLKAATPIASAPFAKSDSTKSDSTGHPTAAEVAPAIQPRSEEVDTSLGEPPSSPATKEASPHPTKTPATPIPAQTAPSPSPPKTPESPESPRSRAVHESPQVEAESSVAGDPSHGTDVDAESPGTRRMSKRRPRRPMARYILAAMTLVVVGQIIYLAVADPGPYVVVRQPRPEPPRNLPPVFSTSRTVAGTSSEASTQDDSSADAYQVVDDARLLFVPPELPTAATDPRDPLMWLPDGVSSVIAVRPKRWADSTTAATLFDGFRNQWREWFGENLRIAGAPLDQIDTLSMGLYAGNDGIPKAVGWVRLVDGVSIDAIVAGWSASADELPGKIQVLRVNEDWVYHVPEATPSIHYLFGDPDLVRSAVRSEGGSTTLPLALDRLWKQMPHDGDLVVAGIPNFFFSDGRQLLERGLPDWNDALRRFMVPDVAATTLWAQADRDLVYVESRMLPSAGLTEAGLLGQWSRWWQTLPESARSRTESLEPTDSLSPLAKRFPAMVEFLISGTRFGIDDGSVTANTYLPADPFAQLGMTGLLLASAPEKPKSTDQAVGRAQPKTAEEMLAVPMTIAFAQEALKPAVENVVEEFARELADGISPPAIEIRGGDLQKNGITQNQQIRDFEQTERPLGEVLTELVMAANPDKTVTDASQSQQMLVWVLDPDAEATTILITTRDAAIANDWPLPDAFVAED